MLLCFMLRDLTTNFGFSYCLLSHMFYLYPSFARMARSAASMLDLSGCQSIFFSGSDLVTKFRLLPLCVRQRVGRLRHELRRSVEDRHGVARA